MFSSPTYDYNELVFREFEVIDAENDGDLDIILIANHGNLLRPSSFSIRLNPIIWINNGSGQFNTYDEKDLFIEEVLVHHVFHTNKMVIFILLEIKAMIKLLHLL